MKQIHNIVHKTIKKCNKNKAIFYMKTSKFINYFLIKWSG